MEVKEYYSEEKWEDSDETEILNILNLINIALELSAETRLSSSIYLIILNTLFLYYRPTQKTTWNHEHFL